MKEKIFPANKSFWLLHCGALLTLQLVEWLGFLLWQEQKLFNALATILWSILFTLYVLVFRQHYLQKNNFSQSIRKRIIRVISYASIGGLLLAFATLASILPFLWDDLISSGIAEKMDVSPSQLMLHMFIGNTVQSQLFLGIWMFIYISITGNRRVKEAELINLRLQHNLKEAELINLTSQLNPHFLFNAINNIRFTIYEDAAKADTMLTNLSDMLRYSLERSKHDKVALSEELEMIERYIALIKVQMEERLQFTLALAPDIQRYLIPPMILQLLIENAVKHGIDQRRDGGEIYLSAELVNNLLVFTINNNCADQPTASMLAQAANTGIGLRNIKQRLHLLYGANASMVVAAGEQLFSVTLSLPRELA